MNSSRTLVSVLAALLFLPVASQAQNLPDAQLWLTTGDRSALFALQPAPVQFAEPALSGPAAQLPAIVVNDMQQYQPIEGFGFALTGGSAQLLMRMTPAKRTALLKEIFSAEGKGIGASYLRVTIGASDMNDHVFSYDDLPAGQTDPNLDKFSLGPDHADVIPVLKEIVAINPHIKILGSPWSAPTWMKTNGEVKGGHLKPEYYDAYAHYFVKYIQGMKAEGITIHAITVQNEPLNPWNTPSMAVFAPEEATFIARHLGPAFEKAGIKTEIQLYDHNPDAPNYALSILGDPEAGKYVAGTAYHLYGGESRTLTEIHNAYPNKNLYLTEQMVAERPDSKSIGIAEPVSRVLIGATRNWSRNVLLWNLAADPKAEPHTDDGGCGTCYGAVTLDGDTVTYNVAYYALAHFSKFIPAGSVRVGSSEADQLPNAAFLTPAGKVVLVVANTGNFPSTFHVMYHGKSLTATMVPGTVATYVW